MPASALEPALREVSDWNVADVNVRVGCSARHPQLALPPVELVQEMDRFGICRAVVSHFLAEEYDIAEGNCALERDFHERFVPAWAASPETPHLEWLASHHPAAVRLSFAAARHNFSPEPWCCGELCEFLQAHSIVTLISCEDIAWDELAALLENFPRLPVVVLDIGYRADRYLFPLLRRCPHLCFDISNYVAHRQLEACVERFGAERAIFGSRLPLYTPATPLAVLASARIGDDARLAIAGGNLRQLLERAS